MYIWHTYTEFTIIFLSAVCEVLQLYVQVPIRNSVHVFCLISTQAIWHGEKKSKKREIPRLAKAFSIRVAKSNRKNFYIFFWSHEAPSAATPPRAIQ